MAFKAIVVINYTVETSSTLSLGEHSTCLFNRFIVGLSISCRKIHLVFGIDVNLVSARFIKGAIQKSFYFLQTSLQNLEYKFIHILDVSPLSLKAGHLKIF